MTKDRRVISKREADRLIYSYAIGWTLLLTDKNEDFFDEIHGGYVKKDLLEESQFGEMLFYPTEKDIEIITERAKIFVTKLVKAKPK